MVYLSHAPKRPQDLYSRHAMTLSDVVHDGAEGEGVIEPQYTIPVDIAMLTN